MKKIIRMARWLAYSLLAITSLAIIVYLALVIINASDEEPSYAAIELRQYIAEMPDPHTADNAFLYYLGIAAPQDTDPITLGEAWLNWAEQDPVAHWENTQPEMPSLHTDHVRKGSLLRDALSKCRRPTPSCLDLLNSDTSQATQELEQLAWLSERYRELLNKERWIEPRATSHFAIPPYYNLSNHSVLHKLTAWHLSRAKNPADAIAQLNNEARFLRRTLAQTETIISRLIITKLLEDNLFWMNALLREYEPRQQAELPSAWQYPLSAAERSFMSVYANEVFLVENLLTTAPPVEHSTLLDRLGKALFDPLIQHQASLNLIAANYRRIENATTQPNAKLANAVSALRNDTETESENESLLRVHNPAGYLLYRFSLNASTIDYPLHVADLEGLRGMLVLATKLRIDGTDPAEVADSLPSANIRNPYTGEPFGWDSESQSLTYRRLVDAKDKTFRLPY